jgi:YD repeat-containing protein
VLAPGKDRHLRLRRGGPARERHDWVGGGVTTFSYDAAGQLTLIERPNGVDTTIGYDAAGERRRSRTARSARSRCCAISRPHDQRHAQPAARHAAGRDRGVRVRRRVAGLRLWLRRARPPHERRRPHLYLGPRVAARERRRGRDDDDARLGRVRAAHVARPRHDEPRLRVGITRCRSRDLDRDGGRRADPLLRAPPVGPPALRRRRRHERAPLLPLRTSAATPSS